MKNQKDYCDSCGEIKERCVCGDWVSTLPVSQQEADEVNAKYPGPTDAEIKEFFDE